MHHHSGIAGGGSECSEWAAPPPATGAIPGSHSSSEESPPPCSCHLACLQQQEGGAADFLLAAQLQAAKSGPPEPGTGLGSSFWAGSGSSSLPKLGCQCPPHSPLSPGLVCLSLCPITPPAALPKHLCQPYLWAFWPRVTGQRGQRMSSTSSDGRNAHLQPAWAGTRGWRRPRQGARTVQCRGTFFKALRSKEKCRQADGRSWKLRAQPPGPPAVVGVGLQTGSVLRGDSSLLFQALRRKQVQKRHLPSHEGL